MGEPESISDILQRVMHLIWLRYVYRTLSEFLKGGEEIDRAGGPRKEGSYGRESQRDPG